MAEPLTATDAIRLGVRTKAMEIKFWWRSTSMQYAQTFFTCKENAKEGYVLFLEL